MCKTNNNIEEIWRDVPNYEDLYQVSNLGRVKSLRDKNNKPREMIMKPQLDKDGYYLIGLRKNGKQKKYFVHRLVALAFIPNPDNLPFINHKDENKTNNCVENLEWCDCKYNVNYGTCQERRVKNIDFKKRTENTDFKKRTENTDYKKKVENTDYKRIAEKLSKAILQLDLGGNLVNEFPSIAEAERQTGFKNPNICKCLKGKIKTAYGFIWRYKEE